VNKKKEKTNTIKEEEPKIQVPTHELLASTLLYNPKRQRAKNKEKKTNTIKEEEPKIQILTHELLGSTIYYLILTPR
jgi:hypothetical protein